MRCADTTGWARASPILSMAAVGAPSCCRRSSCSGSGSGRQRPCELLVVLLASLTRGRLESCGLSQAQYNIVALDVQLTAASSSGSRDIRVPCSNLSADLCCRRRWWRLFVPPASSTRSRIVDSESGIIGRRGGSHVFFGTEQ